MDKADNVACAIHSPNPSKHPNVEDSHFHTQSNPAENMPNIKWHRSPRTIPPIQNKNATHRFSDKQGTRENTNRDKGGIGEQVCRKSSTTGNEIRMMYRARRINMSGQCAFGFVQSISRQARWETMYEKMAGGGRRQVEASSLEVPVGAGQHR